MAFLNRPRFLERRAKRSFGATPTEEEIAKAQRLYDWWNNKSKFTIAGKEAFPIKYNEYMQAEWAPPEAVVNSWDAYIATIKTAANDIAKQIPLLREFIRTRSPSVKKELEISNAWIVNDVNNAISAENNLISTMKYWGLDMPGFYIPDAGRTPEEMIEKYGGRVIPWDFNPSNLEAIEPVPVQPQQVIVLVEQPPPQPQIVQTTPAPVTSVTPQTSAPIVQPAPSPAVETVTPPTSVVPVSSVAEPYYAEYYYPYEYSYEAPVEEKVEEAAKAGMPTWGWIALAGVGIFLLTGKGVEPKRRKRK